jgi:hypothetical protein
MAEQEIIKHTKKVYSIYNSKEHTIWHKIKEFIIEIAIIVFAVSLSIWFHDRSEHAHQQKEVKEFLLGFREDLSHDAEEMKGDKASFIKSRNAYNYITSVKSNTPLNADSLNKHRSWLFNVIVVVPNNGRFEGFKSSGKIGTIENKVLQNEIMDFYQEDMTALIYLTNYFAKRKSKIQDYCDIHVRSLSDTAKNYNTVLSAPEVQNVANDLKDIRQVIGIYDLCLASIDKIIKEIDKEYKNK